MPQVLGHRGYQLSSRDLSGGKSLIKITEIFVDAAQVHMGIWVVGLSSRDLSVEVAPDQGHKISV